VNKTKKFLILIFALWGIWWLFWSASSLDDVPEDGEVLTGEEIVFNDFKLTNPREGWELDSDVCLKNDTKKTTVFQRVNVKSTSKDGTVTTIASKDGSINEDKKKIDFLRNVRVAQADGYRRIFCDHLVYSYKMKIGSSPGAVKIVEDGSLCSGNSMDFNANSRTGKVVGKVHLIINPDTEEKKAFIPPEILAGASVEAEKADKNKVDKNEQSKY